MIGRGGSPHSGVHDYRAYYQPLDVKTKDQPSVLIIDDDIELAHLLRHMFIELGFHTELAFSADEAFKKARSSHPDLVILDWLLGGTCTGADVLKRLRTAFGKFESKDGSEKDKHLDIVTFSQLKSTDIKIPQASYFHHLEHWRKPIGYKALVQRAMQLLDRMEI